MITADSTDRTADEICWTADGFDGCTPKVKKRRGDDGFVIPGIMFRDNFNLQANNMAIVLAHSGVF